MAVTQIETLGNNLALVDGSNLIPAWKTPSGLWHVDEGPILNVQRFGNGLLINYKDGGTQVCWKTPTGLWECDPAPATVPVDPPDPPPAAVRFVWPFDPRPAPWVGGPAGGTVSSEYGPRSGRVHQGIDFAPGINSPIKCIGNGVVYSTSTQGAFGWHVIIEHPGRLFSLYAHMNFRINVSRGQKVAQGTVLGPVGNTGRSFGAHLHMETHVGGLNWNNPGSHMNPRDFFKRYNG